MKESRGEVFSAAISVDTLTAFTPLEMFTYERDLCLSHSSTSHLPAHHTLLSLYTFDMLSSFFTASAFSRVAIKAANQTKRANNRVQVFEDTLSSDPLHGPNPPTPPAPKRVFKRSLNDITADVINRSAKTRKKTGRPPGTTREKKQPRAGPHATPYLPTPPLPSHIVPSRRRRGPPLFPPQPISSPPPSSPPSVWSIPPPSGQPQEENDDVMEDALRDLTNEEFVYLSEYAPEPETDASESRNVFHDLNEYVSEPEQESHQPPPQNRPVRSRKRAKRRYGKSLGIQWMAARKPGERPDKHLLSELRVEENECPYCSAYQYPQECGAAGSKHKYWHCCSNGRVHDIIMASESDPDGLEALEDGEAKDAMRAFEAEIQTSFHDLMYEVEASGDVKTRTKTSKDFQELIISYNNVLSFCSELVIVDYKNSGWATFRSPPASPPLSPLPGHSSRIELHEDG